MPHQRTERPMTSSATIDRTATAPAEATRPSLRAIADPGPLGLAGFALTTFVLSIFNAGILDKGLEPVVLPLALFYGGLAQLLAGMWEFAKNNTFGALAFTSYGAFWMSFAAYVKFVVPTLPADSAHQATGVFLLAWTIFTVYMTVVTLRVSVGLMSVFIPLAITFALLTAGALGQSETVTTIGGYCGLLTACTAWYNSFAGVLNITWGRTVLPLGVRG
jgi:succinate-acetate transporter protein